MNKNSKRQQLIDTAVELLHAEGAQAISVDRVLQEAGVARMTLYKHFRSKDDLILAAQRRRDEDFRTWFKDAADRRVRRPRDRLLAIFDVLDDWLNAQDERNILCRGRTATRQCAELGSMSSASHSRLAEHMQHLLDYVTRVARQAQAEDPEELARELMLLAEGAISTACVQGDADAARRAKHIAAKLVEGRCPMPVLA